MTDSHTHGRIVDSQFEAPRWLRNRHFQTIFPSLPVPRAPRVDLRRQTLELPDGDATVVDWLAGSERPSAGKPLLVVLHGLESSADSNYARQLLAAACRLKWRAAVLHFRDCGDYRNRLPRRYHAGETADFRYFLNHLRAHGQQAPMIAAGFSLGGNVLLKYLGEDAERTPLAAAVAVCVPLDLNACADALTSGFSKVYQKHLLKRMKKAVTAKFDRHTAAFDWNRAMSAVTFADFDDAVTAPLHGFSGKDEYYEKCSSVRFLNAIRCPTLIINSLDDPFTSPAMLPSAEHLAPAVTLELSRHGGHVGYVSGGTPWRPQYYLPGRITRYLSEQLATQAGHEAELSARTSRRKSHLRSRLAARSAARRRNRYER